MAQEKESKKVEKDNELENQSLSDLTDLHKIYMTNFSLHKENGTLNDKREKDILA